MPDSYLWNRTGEPDPEVERLENVLGSLRHQESTLRLKRPTWHFLAAAAAILIFLCVALVGAHRTSWSVDPTGIVRLDDRVIESRTGLSQESVIETGPGARAKLRIGLIGTATLEPGTRVAVERTALRESRLALQHGTISARIGAPPRLFYVSTTSAEAIDLGCAYELSIDSLSGTGALRVTQGWVALDADSGRVFVPRGMSVKILGRGRLSVPVRDDADASFRAAVDDAVGSLPKIRPEQIAVIQRTAVSSDSLTIWHLIRRADADGRSRLAEALVSINASVEVDLLALEQGNEEEIERIGRTLGARESRWWVAWLRQGVGILSGGHS